MRRLAVAIVVITVLCVPASAVGATAPSASGSGAAGPWTFNFSATGDASALSPQGGPATGFATVSHSTLGSFSGSVYCLSMSMDARSANIGVQTSAGPKDLFVYDSKGYVNPITGEVQLDNFDAGPASSFPCATIGNDAHNLDSGDIVVSAGSPGPTTKEQCKHGGWRNYPQFKNQRQCIRFVRRQARQVCIAERSAIGRPAFRAKYGTGQQHRRALRNCVRQKISG